MSNMIITGVYDNCARHCHRGRLPGALLIRTHTSAETHKGWMALALGKTSSPTAHAAAAMLRLVAAVLDVGHPPLVHECALQAKPCGPLTTSLWASGYMRPAGMTSTTEERHVPCPAITAFKPCKHAQSSSWGHSGLCSCNLCNILAHAIVPKQPQVSMPTHFWSWVLAPAAALHGPC